MLGAAEVAAIHENDNGLRTFTDERHHQHLGVEVGMWAFFGPCENPRWGWPRCSSPSRPKDSGVWTVVYDNHIGVRPRRRGAGRRSGCGAVLPEDKVKHGTLTPQRTS